MPTTQQRGQRHWPWRRGMRIRSPELEQALSGERPPVLIDIRSRSAYEKGHLPGAVHVPLTRLVALAARLDRSAPTVVY